MKIEKVRIRNFRCYKDETIALDDYTCFVGSNGSGKSTLLHALNVFFRQYRDANTDLSRLSVNDFHHKVTAEDIEIEVSFHDLSEQAKSDLSDYVRQNVLTITAVAKFDSGTEKAEVKQYGSRLGIEEFRGFFEAEKDSAKKVADLKDIFNGLRETFPELEKASTKQEMIAKLHRYEENHPDKCKPIRSEDQFYGATKGANRLAPHIQWVFVPALKNASEESEETKASAFGQLLARTIRSKVNFEERISELRSETERQYQDLLASEREVLTSLSESLQSRLSAWAHPDIRAEIEWKLDPDKSVRIEEPLARIKLGERGFEGDLSRFGLGLQRSYLLALLQELALLDDETAPTLVMGIEEPEIYQHPPQARYMAETLLDLAEKDAQLLICTHSPLFIPGDHFDKVGIVRECGVPSYTRIKRISYQSLADELKKVGEKAFKETGMVAKLYPTLNPVTNEMFFCRVLVLVEGVEDVAYITSYLSLTDNINKYRKNGCHIVPVGGKNNLIKPLAMARLLGIPTFVVFDADTDKENIANEEKRNSEVAQHKKENKAILMLQGHDSEDEWPKSDLLKDNLICWSTNLTDEIASEFGDDWTKYRDESLTFYGQAGDLQKNPLAIAKTLEFAWLKGKKSAMLTDVAERIITFATNVHT